MVDRIATAWKDVLFTDTTRLLKASGSDRDREHYDAVYFVVKEQPKAKDKPAAQDGGARRAVARITLGRNLAPRGPHISQKRWQVLHCADGLRIDAVTIMRVIRIVTGKRCGCWTLTPPPRSASTT